MEDSYLQAFLRQFEIISCKLRAISEYHFCRTMTNLQYSNCLSNQERFSLMTYLNEITMVNYNFQRQFESKKEH